MPNEVNCYAVIYFYEDRKHKTGVGRTTITVEGGTIYTTSDIAEAEKNICEEYNLINAVVMNIIPLESEGADDE